MQGYSYINLLRKILKIKKKVLVDKSYAEIFKYFLNIINLLFQTIVHMDIKIYIYKTHIINKLKIIRINGNQ